MKESAVPFIQPGIYEHYKGNRYRVYGIGRHSESDDYFVVYAPLYETDNPLGFWLRPYEMFVESVDVGGKLMPRFRMVEAE